MTAFTAGGTMAATRSPQQSSPPPTAWPGRRHGVVAQEVKPERCSAMPTRMCSIATALDGSRLASNWHAARGSCFRHFSDICYASLCVLLQLGNGRRLLGVAESSTYSTGNATNQGVVGSNPAGRAKNQRVSDCLIAGPFSCSDTFPTGDTRPTSVSVGVSVFPRSTMRSAASSSSRNSAAE